MKGQSWPTGLRGSDFFPDVYGLTGRWNEAGIAEDVRAAADARLRPVSILGEPATHTSQLAFFIESKKGFVERADDTGELVLLELCGKDRIFLAINTDSFSGGKFVAVIGEFGYDLAFEYLEFREARAGVDGEAGAEIDDTSGLGFHGKSSGVLGDFRV